MTRYYLYCLQEENPTSKVADISDQLLTWLANNCSCTAELKIISDGEFQCYSESPRQVAYRAQLHHTQVIAALEILNELDVFLTTNSLYAQREVLNINRTCSEDSSVSGVAMCTLGYDVTVGLETTQLSTTAASSAPPSITASIGGVITILILGVFMVIFGGIIFQSMRNFRKKKKEMAPTEFQNNIHINE